MAGASTAEQPDVRTAAESRLRAFATRLERIGLDDFRQVAMSPHAADARAPARAVVLRAIEDAGLTDLAATARADVRSYLDHVYAGGVYRPTWVALNWGLSTGPVQDRLAATALVEDAVLATIADGLAPEVTVDALRGPFELIAEVHPMPQGGDALPTIAEVRRVGPVWAVVAVLVLGLSLVGWVVGGWPILAVAGAIVIGAWLLAGRHRAGTSEP
jgi:hypothetical protein